MIEISIVTVDDDLALLVDEINQAAWDAANEMTVYDVPSLRCYLEHQDTLFVTCHERTESGRTLLGFASSRVEIKPYGNERWLYVDEVDVCSDQRRKGAGTAIMRKLIDLALSAGCVEVWLGTEDDNLAANALYQSLEPGDVSRFVGYTFEMNKPILPGAAV